MKRLLIVTVVAIFYFVFDSQSAEAQATNAAQQSPTTDVSSPGPVNPAITKPSSQTPEDALQVQLLKQQNALLMQHNTELLQVVLWAIGFAAAFLLGFLGLFGYLTYRRYEQEKEALTTLLKGELATDVARLDARVSEKAQILETNQHENAKVALASMQQEAKRIVDGIVRPFDQRLRNLDQTLADLHLTVVEQDAEVWILRKVPNNMIRAWFKYTQMAKKSDCDWQISKGLEKILEAFQTGAKFTGSDIATVTEFIAALPPKYDALAAKIKQAL